MKWRHISDFVRKEKEGTELLPKRTPKEGDIFSGALFSKITLTRFALQKKKCFAAVREVMGSTSLIEG